MAGELILDSLSNELSRRRTLTKVDTDEVKLASSVDMLSLASNTQMSKSGSLTSLRRRLSWQVTLEVEDSLTSQPSTE